MFLRVPENHPGGGRAPCLAVPDEVASGFGLRREPAPDPFEAAPRHGSKSSGTSGETLARSVVHASDRDRVRADLGSGRVPQPRPTGDRLGIVDRPRVLRQPATDPAVRTRAAANLFRSVLSVATGGPVGPGANRAGRARRLGDRARPVAASAPLRVRPRRGQHRTRPHPARGRGVPPSATGLGVVARLRECTVPTSPGVILRWGLRGSA